MIRIPYIGHDKIGIFLSENFPYDRNNMRMHQCALVKTNWKQSVAARELFIGGIFIGGGLT